MSSAITCGCTHCVTKIEARRFLAGKFGEPPADIRFTKNLNKPVANSADYAAVAQKMRNKKKAHAKPALQNGMPHVPMPPPSGVDPRSTEFLMTYEWRRVRMMALKKYGTVCQCCGAGREQGAVINVDHIKPRKFFPQLALDISNLQVLCGECNEGKGNWDMTDWRLPEEQRNHLRSI